jgi:hypothetical protein
MADARMHINASSHCFSMDTLFDAPLSPLLNPFEGPNVELRKIEDLRAAPDFQH